MEPWLRFAPWMEKLDKILYGTLNAMFVLRLQY
jgi:hypothetical protein